MQEEKCLVGIAWVAQGVMLSGISLRSLLIHHAPSTTHHRSTGTSLHSFTTPSTAPLFASLTLLVLSLFQVHFHHSHSQTAFLPDTPNLLSLIILAFTATAHHSDTSASSAALASYLLSHAADLNLHTSSSSTPMSRSF